MDLKTPATQGQGDKTVSRTLHSSSLSFVVVGQEHVYESLILLVPTLLVLLLSII